MDTLGAITFNKEYMRFLHPLGVLTFVITLPVFFLISGFKGGREMIQDHFRMW